MPSALFRVQVPGAGVRLARGTIEGGPADLLDPDLRIDALLSADAEAISLALRDEPSHGDCPADARILAPIENQEVWCTGLTYERTYSARLAGSGEPSIYSDLYDAERPELFFKAPGWRVRGPGEPVAVRADSEWDMAEPELGLVIAADGGVAGYLIGDDVTSRSLEAANPLYLPQAKVYDGSCALGPAIVPADEVSGALPIRMLIRRDGTVVFQGETSTARLRRPLDDIVRHLFRALTFPAGVVLLSGNGVVPDPSLRLLPGDIVRIEMGPLGVLENPVQAVG